MMARNSRGLHVLVVDDEALMRWSVAETLRDAGCSVVEAADAAAALLQMSTASQPFDVVVVDYQLPDADHFSLVSAIKRLAPNCRLILMTAFGTPQILKEAGDLGVRDVLAKPFELAELARLVRSTPSKRHG